MPFFLFIAGVSLALVHKRISNEVQAAWKTLLKAVDAFFSMFYFKIHWSITYFVRTRYGCSDNPLHEYSFGFPGLPYILQVKVLIASGLHPRRDGVLLMRFYKLNTDKPSMENLRKVAGVAFKCGK